MAQWRKVPGAKHDDLSLSPRTHVAEGDISSCKFLHKRAVACVYTNIHKINVIRKERNLIRGISRHNSTQTRSHEVQTHLSEANPKEPHTVTNVQSASTHSHHMWGARRQRSGVKQMKWVHLEMIGDIPLKRHYHYPSSGVPRRP